MNYNINIISVNDELVNSNYLLKLNSIGEGIVWKVAPHNFVESKPFINWTESRFWFKVKGEKHSGSKVKKLASVNVEKVSSINELVEKVVTENRLLQGIQSMEEISMTNIGPYIQWVKNDVFKEEMDTIIESGLEPKDCISAISNKARKFFLDYYNRT